MKFRIGDMVVTNYNGKFLHGIVVSFMREHKYYNLRYEIEPKSGKFSTLSCPEEKIYEVDDFLDQLAELKRENRNKKIDELLND